MAHRKTIFKVLAVVATIILLFFFFRKTEQIVDESKQIELINALNDSIRYYKDENRKKHSYIQVLETEKIETFLSLKTSNEEIKELQEVIRKNKNRNLNSATTLKVITKVDTLFVRDTVENFSRFSVDYDFDGWVYGSIRIEDTTGVHMTTNIKNEFNIVQGVENGKQFLDITSKNPYSEVTTQRHWIKSTTIKQKNKNFGVGPNISVGVNANGNIQPFIGVGVQYNLLKF